MIREAEKLCFFFGGKGSIIGFKGYLMFCLDSVLFVIFCLRVKPLEKPRLTGGVVVLYVVKKTNLRKTNNQKA